MNEKTGLSIVCGLITLLVIMLCSIYGKKMMKLVPFVIGIVAGYAVAAVFTAIGNSTGNEAMQLINFAPIADNFKNIDLSTFVSVPNFTFLTAFSGFGELSGSYIATLAVAYVPVAFVVFAEHIADHKNLSTIIERELLEDPGLSRTLLGDGVGSMAGSSLRWLPQHHLRRVGRLCRNHQERIGRFHSRRRNSCHHHLLLHSLCALPLLYSLLRNGRRVRSALRIYSRIGS